jgi:hypothetical protein
MREKKKKNCLPAKPSLRHKQNQTSVLKPATVAPRPPATEAANRLLLHFVPHLVLQQTPRHGQSPSIWVGGGMLVATTIEPGNTLNALPGNCFPQMKKTWGVTLPSSFLSRTTGCCCEPAPSTLIRMLRRRVGLQRATKARGMRSDAWCKIKRKKERGLGRCRGGTHAAPAMVFANTCPPKMLAEGYLPIRSR